jgi:hypothetical protein
MTAISGSRIGTPWLTRGSRTSRETPRPAAPRKSNPAPRAGEQPLPDAPAPGERVRIPLDQLHAYLAAHNLKITRRIDTDEPGGWYIELQEDTPT